MPTEATAKSKVVVEYIDELLLKLVGPPAILSNAQELLHKYRKQMEKVARRNRDHGPLLTEIIAFDEKFSKLPDSWDQLEGFVERREKNDEPLHQIRELRTQAEDVAYRAPDLEILMTNVWDDSERGRVSNICRVAAKIATGGMTIKDEAYKGPEDAKRFLLGQLGSEQEPVELEPGETELFSGQAGARTFKFIGTPVCEIKSKPITWLWPERIPLGGWSLYGGKPGRGKSQAICDLAARVSTGKDFPDGAKNTLGPRDVLLLSAEDDAEKIIRPRLLAAGADVSRITLLTKVVAQDHSEEDSSPEKREMMLSEDVEALRQYIAARPNLALVIVDTITSYYGDVNPNVDKEIRPILNALGRAFGECEASFLAVTHYNKRSDSDAIGKILGGSSVAGSARAAWDFSQDSEDKNLFRMTCIKNNWGKEQTGLTYSIADREVEEGITAPYIDWKEKTEETADDVIAKERDSAGRKENKQIDLARMFLPQALAKGPRLARELFKEAEAEGISERQLKKAKYELTIHSVQKTDGWYWFLHMETEQVIPQITEEVI